MVKHKQEVWIIKECDYSNPNCYRYYNVAILTNKYRAEELVDDHNAHLKPDDLSWIVGSESFVLNEMPR